MARFKVAWNYSSSAGTFEEGTIVEVDDPVAEHINRDSPGVLIPVKKKAAEPVAVDTPVEEPTEPKPRKR